VIRRAASIRLEAMSTRSLPTSRSEKPETIPYLPIELWEKVDASFILVSGQQPEELLYGPAALRCCSKELHGGLPSLALPRAFAASRTPGFFADAHPAVFLRMWLERWDDYAIFWAFMHGRLDVVKSLHALDCPWDCDESAVASAAARGHLEIVKWLREQQSPPCPWDEWAVRSAAAHGHLEIVKWLREQQSPPCPWDESAVEVAAYNGHLEIVKWLREQRPPCPWDEWAVEAAAAGGHLEIVKWLREHGAPRPWYESAAEAAEYGGHLEVAEWRREPLF